ncbi:MAG TPA: UbiX family flavin prenyltransferase [Methanolinea sp.]|jgi:4-hydroxy-3-polyprenylbenzoate decarboxylase|nr:UbiX family flavin prenyltransferase [Methanolinea sp.]HOS81886.1 UbiX family flavin prenyltransferase [Methanolinea sp.]HPC55421.1 UbiX family flavin prenyltransferase [Methanolinea sp.]HQE85505.1 UbiX family flavin prenyltransferase [Methanolinea sp.]HQI14358.1 UbiX family flavin prenyltransferase [Methanolinea sp.]
MAKTRIIVALSGASGIVYGIRLLEAARELGLETDLIMTDLAARMIGIETSLEPDQVNALATRVHDSFDFTSPLASGGIRHQGMVVIPCSMKTVAGIACGFSDNLLLRAADCTLKERRPLVLVPRETPLSAIHLRNMLTLAEAGAVILPACPGFYHRPRNIQGLVDHVVGKVFDILGIEHQLYRKWREGETT